MFRQDFASIGDYSRDCGVSIRILVDHVHLIWGMDTWTPRRGGETHLMITSKFYGVTLAHKIPGDGSR